MTIGSILLGLALLIVVTLFLSQPFLKTKVPTATTVPLTLQKEALLAQIQSLEFDHETGKVPTDSYDKQRQQLIIQAALILQEMDGTIETNSIDAEIEAAIQKLRTQKSTSTVTTTTFCPQCGNNIDESDNFCAHCGHTLQPATA